LAVGPGSGDISALPMPASGEQCAVGVEGRLAAEVGVEHRGGGVDFAAADQVDQPGYGLALVDRVGDHAFGAGGESPRAYLCGGWHTHSRFGRQDQVSSAITFQPFPLFWQEIPADSARPSFVLTMRSNGRISLHYLRRVDWDDIRDDGLGAARSTRYTRLVIEPGRYMLPASPHATRS